MIKAINWAMRTHPDKVTTIEKLVLIGLADMCQENLIITINFNKLARFACLEYEQARKAVENLANKGFIQSLDNNICETTQFCTYKLIVTQ